MNDTSGPTLRDWRTESLRLTAFPVPSATTVGLDWWKETVGIEPETRLVQPRKAAQQEYGEIDGARLNLNIEATRIDWLLVEVEDRAENSDLPGIGPLDESLEKFNGLMERWFSIPTCPTVKRLAFGSILHQFVGSREEGYVRLGRLLPGVKLDSEGSSDFSYQINRPRLSRYFTGLNLNRLSKWSVSLHVRAGIRVRLGAAEYLPGRQLQSVRLELDINTSPEFAGEFGPPDLMKLWPELVELGVEIAERGDIA